MDKDELSKRLGISLPRIYLDFVQQNDDLDGFDPKTLCVLNLELLDGDRDWVGENRFFLSGDGCGNYFFCEATISGNDVYLLSHDPEGIESPGIQLLDFLTNYQQENPIQTEVDHGYSYLSKTTPFGESILNPITIEEWQSVVAETDGVVEQGYLKMINPFSGEETHLPKPGLSIISTGSCEYDAELICGRVIIRGELSKSDKVLESLAKKINCQIFAH